MLPVLFVGSGGAVIASTGEISSFAVLGDLSLVFGSVENDVVIPLSSDGTEGEGARSGFDARGDDIGGLVSPTPGIIESRMAAAKFADVDELESVSGRDGCRRTRGVGG